MVWYTYKSFCFVLAKPPPAGVSLHRRSSEEKEVGSARGATDGVGQHEYVRECTGVGVSVGDGHGVGVVASIAEHGRFGIVPDGGCCGYAPLLVRVAQAFALVHDLQRICMLAVSPLRVALLWLLGIHRLRLGTLPQNRAAASARARCPSAATKCAV